VSSNPYQQASWLYRNAGCNLPRELAPRFLGLFFNSRLRKQRDTIRISQYIAIVIRERLVGSGFPAFLAFLQVITHAAHLSAIEHEFI
jgi:hypothetical protein